MIQHDISNVPMFTAVPSEVIFYGRTVSALRRCLRAAGLGSVSVVRRWAPCARRALRDFVARNPQRRDLPFDLGRGVDHLLLALPLDHAWIRRGAALLEDDRVPARLRAAASAFLDRERAALDADPERFFRGLLEGADLRSRLFGHARSDWVHDVGYGRADAWVRGFAAFFDDGARVARAKRAAAVGGVVVGGLVLARAFALLA